MPWTLAHPAVVLPFAGRLVPGAMVAGAMAPDLWFHLPPVLAPWTPSGWWTHGPLSPVSVGLVAGLAMFGLWRGLVRVPVLAALPDPWGAAAVRATAVLAPRLRRRTRPRRWGLVVASVALGAATHVAIDVLTHEPGGVNPGWEWLETRIGPLRAYLWLQYLLSLVGLALLAWWGARWAAGVADLRGFRVTPALASLLATTGAGAAVGAWLRSGGDPIAGIDESVTAWLSTLLRGGVAGGALALLVWSAVSRRRRRAAPARSRSARPEPRTRG